MLDSLRDIVSTNYRFVSARHRRSVSFHSNFNIIQVLSTETRVHKTRQRNFTSRNYFISHFQCVDVHPL